MGISPASTRAISLIEFLPAPAQLLKPLAGSVSVPKTICRSNSKIIFSRDSVPTN